MLEWGKGAWPELHQRIWASLSCFVKVALVVVGVEGVEFRAPLFPLTRRVLALVLVLVLVPLS